MDFPFAHDPSELKYAQRWDELYEEVLFWHSPVFRLPYCCFTATYDCIPFLGYYKLWRAIIKFAFENRADVGGPFFLSWHNQEFYVVHTKECRRLYLALSEWWHD